MLNRRILTFSAAMLAVGWPRQVLAQSDYPTRPIKLIVPFGGGGITDVVARLVAQGLTERLGQSVVVENRPGAGGSIGAQVVASAEADGYTLLLGTVGTQVVNRMVYPKLSYDPAAFVPVSLVSNSPYVLAVAQSLKLDSLPAGDVDFAALRAAKLVPSTAKRAKVVAKGEVTKAFVLKGIAATAGAKAAIEAAGGKLAE